METAMQSKLLHEAHGQRSFALILEIGDDLLAQLQGFAHENLSAASLSAIGAFENATLAFWNWETKEYERIPVNEQVEVLSLNGDVALDDKAKPKLHVHAVLGRRDGSVVGGHLLEARVRPTLEVVLVESPTHLQRRHDETTGLPLIRIS
jgi:uncharacterized protein